MKKSNRIKHWQLNVIVEYYGEMNANSYRFDILELFKHLASIYKLDYAFSIEHQFPCDFDSFEQPEDQFIFDLIYFRSNEYSRIERKDLRDTINSMFRNVPSQFFEGVDIEAQLYKFLKDFPFPKDFYRPLKHPWIEHHRDGKKKVLMYADALMKVIEEEQNYPKN